MECLLLLLLPLVSANEGKILDRFQDGCNSHCTYAFDKNLSCWNKTAEFFGKTLVGVFLRYVTTQQSIGRMMDCVEYYNSDMDLDSLTAEIINETVMALISSSFKAVRVPKQPSLLPCPQGCEISSSFWLSLTSMSLLLSGLLTVFIIIKTLEKDRIDHKHGFGEAKMKSDRYKAN